MRPRPRPRPITVRPRPRPRPKKVVSIPLWSRDLNFPDYNVPTLSVARGGVIIAVLTKIRAKMQGPDF